MVKTAMGASVPPSKTTAFPLQRRTLISAYVKILHTIIKRQQRARAAVVRLTVRRVISFLRVLKKVR
jgi:hypothetical protein